MGLERKTYRAIRHDVVREKQKKNADEVHHPNQKIRQIKRVLSEINIPKKIRILELFAGRGNLTKIYSEFGSVLSYDKTYLKTGDSFLEYHRLIADKKKFEIIDLDPYGFPNRFFPDIFLLIDKGFLFITMPKPYVNILNGITQTHITTYFDTYNPSKEQIIERTALFGLCHWRKVILIDEIDCGAIWRFVFEVQKIKSTEYTGVSNRCDKNTKSKNVQLGLFD